MNNPKVKAWPFELRSGWTENVVCLAAQCLISEAEILKKADSSYSIISWSCVRSEFQVIRR